MGTVDSTQKTLAEGCSVDRPAAGATRVFEEERLKGGFGEVRDSACGGENLIGKVGRGVVGDGSTKGNDRLEDFEMNGVSSLLKMKESSRRLDGGGKAEDLDSLFGGMDIDKNGEGVQQDVDGHTVQDGGVKPNRGSSALRNGELSLDLNSDGQVDDMAEHQYSVGDFVWGKIKNHPWWPGQIYDPSDASDFAVKHRTSNNKILVAYFGDGTFAWCHPSQLKPFEENFEAISRQSTSKNFSNAIEAAVNQIGRVVNLKMTCLCVPRSVDSAVGGQLAINSGIKEGVFVPNGGIEKLSVCQLEPSELLSNVKKMAGAPFASSFLYSAVVKNWLMAFYRMNGICELLTYYEPVPVPGLEDQGDAAVDSTGKVGIPFQGPVLEESLSPASKESALKKCTGISGDGVNPRRKEKSILEILGLNREGTDGITSVKKIEDENAVESKGDCSKHAISKKRPADVELDDSGCGMAEAKRRGRKKKASSGAEIDLSEISVTAEVPVISEAEANVSETAQECDGDEDKFNKVSYLRERKKSKYLSPPFTNVTRGRKKKDKEADSSNASGISQIGERLKRAAGHLMGTPSTSEGKVEDSLTKVLENSDMVGDKTPEQRLFDLPNEEEHMTIDTKEWKASANDVLNEVRDAALDPKQAKETGTVSDDVEMFLPLYGSSVYHNGSNCEEFNKCRPGRKRKSPDKELLLSLEGAQINGKSDTRPQKESATEEVAAKSDTKTRKNRATEEVSPKSDTKPRKKRATKEVTPQSDTKPLKKRATEEVTPKSKANSKNRLLGEAGAKEDVGCLLITFEPGSSLPTKEDLITIYSKYGNLDKNETVVHYNSKYALVVFNKISEAEEALKCSQAASPFGSLKTEFELRANSAPYGTKEQTDVPRKRGRKPKVRAVESSAGDISDVQSIKQKLEKISSVLEKSDGKLSRQVKSDLKGEIMGLLELVSSTSGSTSS